MDASPPHDKSSGGRTATLLVIVFVAAAATTALELLLPRLLAPHVGTTTVPWATSIAVVLLGMAAGNAAGGLVADRTVRMRSLVSVLLVAGVGVAVLATRVGSKPLFESGPLGVRAFLLSIAAAPAAVFLGMVSPFATTIAARTSERRGRVVGRFIAAGALGSLVGVYATGFAIIPLLSLRTAFLLLGGVIAALAVALALGGRRALRTAAPIDAEKDARATPGDGPAIGERSAVALALAAGLATLILEIVAARTAARIIGNGLYAWTSVLGAVLAGLTIGAALGGILADRPDRKRTLARLLVAASATTLLAAWSPNLLVWLTRESGAGRPLRIAIGAALAWLVPSAALGAIPPVVARAALGGGHDGFVIGRVWAFQTIGSVAGALVTGPLLIPLVSTSGSLVLVALALALLPLLIRARVEMPWVAGLAVAFLGAVLPFPAAATVGRALALRADGHSILVRESAYQLIRVDEPTDPKYAGLGRPRLRQLALDGLVHNVVDLDDPDWLGYGYEGLYAAVTARHASHAPPPRRALFVGGGACTFSRWLHRRMPDVDVDVVELDPEVTRAAKDAMGLAEEPGFRIIHADGRTFVRGRKQYEPRYDLIYGDAYDDVAVPWHLATREYAEEIRRILAPDGAYLMNVIDAEGGGRFLAAVVTTLREAFRPGSVSVVSLNEPSDGRDTFVVVATSLVDAHYAGLRRLDPAQRSGETLRVKTFEPLALEDLVQKAKGLVLTDDHAPVEWLVAPVAGASSR